MASRVAISASRISRNELQPAPEAVLVASPPNKRDLASWWKNFKKNNKKEESKATPSGIFGVPLQVSIRYANVAISLLDNEGRSFIYGYVPIVVAKCGVFLKERAQNVEGIFRLAGAERRIKELEEKFDSPDRYGKGLDWDGYTVHDAANILRRYFNKLPEPIIPLEFYDKFREPIRTHEAEAVGPFMDTPMEQTAVGGFDRAAAIRTYQRLITELPPLNRQLLLYILDLLAVFASKSDVNKMTSANLASIFQPGLLSHPQHDMAPIEYKLSQYVLVFLIENQDSFLIGMKGTAADAQTVKDVQSGSPLPQPRTPPTPTTPGHNRSTGIGRSASTASAGTDSLHRYGGLRRDVSVSSQHSRQSPQSPSPVTPSPYGTPTGSGVHRSNTAPSRKSSGIHGPRFRAEKPSPPSTPSPTSLVAPTIAPAPASRATTATARPTPHMDSPSANLTVPSQNGERRSLSVAPSMASSGGVAADRSPSFSPIASGVASQESLLPKDDKMYIDSPPVGVGGTGSALTPTKEKSLASLFSIKMPADGTRQPRKLQKKRLPESRNLSAHSSSQSLNSHSTAEMSVSPGIASRSPAATQSQFDGSTGDTRDINNEFGNSQSLDLATDQVHRMNPPEQLANCHRTSDTTLKPAKPSAEELVEPAGLGAQAPQGQNLRHAASPSGSFSQSSATDFSEHENIEDLIMLSPEKKERKSRWRFSNHKQNRSHSRHGSGSGNHDIGTHASAQRSTSSMSSSAGRPGQSFMDDSYQANPEGSPTGPKSKQVVGDTIGSGTANQEREREKEEKQQKGPIDWFRNKWQERKERDGDKDRAKSPPPSMSSRASSSIAAGMGSEKSESKQSLNAIIEGGRTRRRGPSGASSGREDGVLKQPPAPSLSPNKAGGLLPPSQQQLRAASPRPPIQIDGAEAVYTPAQQQPASLRPPSQSQPPTPSPRQPSAGYMEQQGAEPEDFQPALAYQPQTPTDRLPESLDVPPNDLDHATPRPSDEGRDPYLL